MIAVKLDGQIEVATFSGPEFKLACVDAQGNRYALLQNNGNQRAWSGNTEENAIACYLVEEFAAVDVKALATLPAVVEHALTMIDEFLDYSTDEQSAEMGLPVGMGLILDTDGVFIEQRSNATISYVRLARVVELTTYRVSAGGADLLLSATCQQHAKDLFCQHAGYRSEADMCNKINQDSEIVVREYVK